MLRNILDGLADVLRDEIGSELAADGIDAEIEPRLVMSPSEAVVLDIYPAAPSRDGEAAAFGDLSGFYVLTVRARVTISDDATAQDILVDMTDDNHSLSVAAAIESDQTLGGYRSRGCWSIRREAPPRWSVAHGASLWGQRFRDRHRNQHQP